MSEGLVIRNAERTDLARWLPLWEGYNAFYEREGPTAISMEMNAGDLGAVFRWL